MENKPYQKLANAIVGQSAEDWKKTSTAIARNKGKEKTNHVRDAIRLKEQCERFLKGEWCCLLSNADGEYILNRTKKEWKEWWQMEEILQELKKARKLQLLIRNKKELLSSLKAQAYGLSGSGGGERVQEKNENRDGKIINMISNIIETESLIAKKEKEFTECVNKNIALADLLTDEKEKNIMTYRYILFYEWPIIAKKTNYSMAYVKQIHGNALKKLKIIPNNTK